MARGWGNAPPDLKGTLGTLLRTTLIQLGSLRDVAVTQLRAGGRELATRSPILSRELSGRRTDVLASLGEIIYELARAGELDLDDFPELASAISELEAIDASRRSSEHDDARHDTPSSFGLGDFSSAAFEGLEDSNFVGESISAPVSQSGRVWRPDPNDYDDDGTVRSVTQPAGSRVSEADTRPERRPDQTLEDLARPARPSRRSAAGHIAFVADDRNDDDDLAEYMHEDDVPE